MKNYLSICTLAATILISVSLRASDETSPILKSLWIGSHYTDFSDYSLKVGEFNLGDSKLLPELGLALGSSNRNNIFDLEADYYDHRNIFGVANVSAGSRLFAQLKYRSLTKLMEQDLLSNLETREWLSTRAGGKILTHDLADSGADYNLHRQEIASRVDVRLSKKNDIRMMVVHRSQLNKADQQHTSQSHCYSCHVVSQTVKSDKRTHQFEGGLQADVKETTLGYAFNFRATENFADPVLVHYDSASHPVSGASGSEFSSRLVFDDTTIAAGVTPKTRKVSHKARAKGDLAGGKWSGSLSYSQAKNVDTEISANIIGATVNYAVSLSKRTRLTMKASAIRQNVDDVFVDLPTYRAGRPGPQIDFDFTRHSSLNRLDGKGSAELTTKLNPRAVLSLLASFNRIERGDYPYYGADQVTSKAAGQAKLRYRPTSKLTASLSYRYEKTTQPFTSGRGLFEAPGRDALEPLAPNFAFIFYFQREALRYQTITTLPTDRHELNVGTTLLSSSKSFLNLHFRGVFDKNADLDSLDVKHSSLQPTVDFTMTPNPRWSHSIGYSYNFEQTRLPITMPLFDG